MWKTCNDPELGCDMNCWNCEVPTIEPEDCEYCREEAEENGIDYEADFTHINGRWECCRCGRGC